MQSIQLAVTDLNKNAHPKIELIIEDDQSDPKNTLTAYSKLKNSNVDAILGPTWAHLTNNIIPLAARDKPVILNTTATPEVQSLALSNGYAFANLISMKKLLLPIKFYLKRQPISSAVILYTSNSFGEVQRQEIKSICKELGINVIEEIASIKLDEND